MSANLTWLRFGGRLTDLPAPDRTALLDRAGAVDPAVGIAVRAIIADVRALGDAALFDMAKRLDGVSLESTEVPPASIARALDETPAPLRAALERAARNIATLHSAAMPVAAEICTEPGIRIGRRPDPLGRVGVYAPGGRASYPSSVLMGAVPARIAGVGEIVLCCPPTSTGLPSASVLAAAAIAGVDRVFAIGGAGAIAAMAHGTASVPRVDRIVGPGNAYVAEAKLQLVGVVAIDSPAGPSELLVIADDLANPDAVACEMIAQAEHDPLACVVAVATSVGVAEAIQEALARAVANAERQAIVRAALAGQGGVLVADDVAVAVSFANAYAPEHLLLAVRDPLTALARVRNAGTVFVGTTSSVAFGDYMTGANHVLPTGGLARSYSGLSPLDFIRWTTYQIVDEAAAQRLADDVALLADAESLPGHAAAARRWSAR
jgi:histidinol dehydrogenase